LVVLLLISVSAFWLQDVAAATLRHEPVSLARSAVSAVEQSWELWGGLATGQLGGITLGRGTFGGLAERPLSQILSELFWRSLVLLLLAMLAGGLLGGFVGVLAAAARRSQSSMGLILLSIVGVSTPSFFLGMLLQYLEILFYKTTGVQLLPVGGFGWDAHLVLPVLVLAARPIAQVTRLTYVRVGEILDRDYVRTARAKGLWRWQVWGRHVLPNAAATVLTAMGTSLRFSLSSLPVVEFLFGWPGAGRAMLDTLRSGQTQAATVLVVIMGALFVLVNMLLDVAYRALDPRLARQPSQSVGAGPVRARLGDLGRELLGGLSRLLRGRRADPMAPLPDALQQHLAADTDGSQGVYTRARREAWRRAVLGNPALALGAVLALVLVVAVVLGPSLARYPTNELHTTLLVAGEELHPPLAPSAAYALGTDVQGRDILSLLLVGARRTMVLALLAAVLRLLLGGMLGFVAGWNAGGRLDRLIMGLGEALSAFPALLMAMLLVYALGIRQGLSTFVLALALVGWSEVMQTVRGQVLAIRPRAFVEAARSTGLSEQQILSAHVLPNVWPTMVSLAFLEMGGVLMLLGELGFLGVFIGGGLAAEGEALPSLVYYDIAEWSVMLANSWRAFRSYPWTMLYPGLAFFVAILGFTLLGEGIRFLTERLTLSFRALFNRYTLAALVLLVFGGRAMMTSTGYPATYAPKAETLYVQRALADIEVLASPRFAGRLSGSKGGDETADWLAARFAELGLQSAGEEADSYFQTVPGYYRDLVGRPELVFTGPDGQTIRGVYGADFARRPGQWDVGGVGSGELVLVADGTGFSLSRQQGAQELGITMEDYVRTDRIVYRLLDDDLAAASTLGRSGTLSATDADLAAYPYRLLQPTSQLEADTTPSLVLSRELAERVITASGQDMADFTRRLPRAPGDRSLYIPTGWQCQVRVPAFSREGVPVRNVIAFWPGSDVALDAELIVLSAYYDGLGFSHDGTMMPGANDNASGVATMLEVVRTLRAQGFVPKRTIMVVGWVGGERQRVANYTRFLDARLGFAEAYDVVAGIALEGVGAGSGDRAVLTHVTRVSLQEVLQQAAGQVGTRVSTNLPGLHDELGGWEAPSGSVPSLTVSWQGADDLAHRPTDTIAQIDADKLGQVGRMVSLATMVLANDPAY
jgi:ABC-type dipeptide/oligopeptide/nickel transport system permease subunit